MQEANLSNFMIKSSSWAIISINAAFLWISLTVCKTGLHSSREFSWGFVALKKTDISRTLSSRVGLPSGPGCPTQPRLGFSVGLGWRGSTQPNRVESDPRPNPVNPTGWPEPDCRPTSYQIPYQIPYQSDQTPYQTPYHIPYHVPYHISHHIPHYIPHHIPYHVPYHVPYHIPYHVPYHIPYHIPIIFPTMFPIIFPTIFSTTLSIIFPTIFPSYSPLYSLSYFSPAFLSNSLPNWLQNWLQKKKMEKKGKSILFLVTKIGSGQPNSILSWARVEKGQLNLNSNSDLIWIDSSQLNPTLTRRQT